MYDYQKQIEREREADKTRDSKKPKPIVAVGGETSTVWNTITEWITPVRDKIKEEEFEDDQFTITPFKFTRNPYRRMMQVSERLNAMKQEDINRLKAYSIFHFRQNRKVSFYFTNTNKQERLRNTDIAGNVHPKIGVYSLPQLYNSSGEILCQLPTIHHPPSFEYVNCIFQELIEQYFHSPLAVDTSNAIYRIAAPITDGDSNRDFLYMMETNNNFRSNYAAWKPWFRFHKKRGENYGYEISNGIPDGVPFVLRREDRPIHLYSDKRAVSRENRVPTMINWCYALFKLIAEKNHMAKDQINKFLGFDQAQDDVEFIKFMEVHFVSRDKKSWVQPNILTKQQCRQRVQQLEEICDYYEDHITDEPIVFWSFRNFKRELNALIPLLDLSIEIKPIQEFQGFLRSANVERKSKQEVYTELTEELMKIDIDYDTGNEENVRAFLAQNWVQVFDRFNIGSIDRISISQYILIPSGTWGTQFKLFRTGSVNEIDQVKTSLKLVGFKGDYIETLSRQEKNLLLKSERYTIFVNAVQKLGQSIDSGTFDKYEFMKKPSQDPGLVKELNRIDEMDDVFRDLQPTYYNIEDRRKISRDIKKTVEEIEEKWSESIDHIQQARMNLLTEKYSHNLMVDRELFEKTSDFIDIEQQYVHLSSQVAKNRGEGIVYSVGERNDLLGDFDEILARIQNIVEITQKLKGMYSDKSIANNVLTLQRAVAKDQRLFIDDATFAPGEIDEIRKLKIQTDRIIKHKPKFGTRTYILIGVLVLFLWAIITKP